MDLIKIPQYYIPKTEDIFYDATSGKIIFPWNWAYYDHNNSNRKNNPGLKHLSMLENGLKVYKIIIDY